ncbi:MAG: hypothetical protein KDC98_07075 [Planctomycetes bacterium]|nr:hypothetical protein [Planctomycetota bacterium]
MIGAGAIAIVIILVVMMRGGGDEKADTPAVAPPAASPAGGASSAPVQVGTPKAGKKPDRPAPELTQETLSKLDQLLAEAKTHYNEGVKKRTAGDNSGAREAQAKAKTLLDEWQALVATQLRWQEEAEMEGWEQPGTYDLLSRRYPKFSSLEKSVRMGGGK